jgi:hypothetical protein
MVFCCSNINRLRQPSNADLPKVNTLHFQGETYPVSKYVDTTTKPILELLWAKFSRQFLYPVEVSNLSQINNLPQKR